MHPYPIDHILPELKKAVFGGPAVVLQAPPGSGKTTRVPLALLKAMSPAQGRIIMLEPRRIAAVAAARWMARLLGEPVGKTIGYTIRFDRRISKETRLEVVTEGILTRRLIDDPALEGVAMIIFDEFHERSLQADLALALSLDIQRSLREDLKLLVMSATIETAPIAALLGGAPVIAAAGETFPVAEHFLSDEGWPRGRGEAWKDRIVGAVRTALRDTTGDILIFLPGAGEIHRAAASLQDVIAGWEKPVSLHPLYGDLPFAEQERAIMPGTAAEDHPGDEYRRNKPHHRRGPGRDRWRPGPEAPVRPGNRHEPPHDGHDLPGLGDTAPGPGGAPRAGHLLSPVQPPCL